MICTLIYESLTERRIHP